MNDRLLKRLILEAIQDTLDEGESEGSLMGRLSALKADLRKTDATIESLLNRIDSASPEEKKKLAGEFSRLLTQTYKIDDKMEKIKSKLSKRGPLQRDVDSDEDED